MTISISRVSIKTVTAAISAILISSVSLQAHAFIFLIPLVAGDGDKSMKSSDIRNTLVENTIIVELPEGTGYALLQADGGSVGLDPVHGKVEGNWKLDSEGETCVTWNYPSGAVTKCANVLKLGDGKYQWGERKFSVRQGDVKNLIKK